MATLTAVLPTIVASTPSQPAISAADKFLAQPGCSYLLHYENGATVGTLQLYVTNQNTTVPPGAATPAVPTNGTNWSDVLVSAALAANGERDVLLDKSIIQNFMDATGFVNLKHNGTITTITLTIYGPF